MKWKRAMVYSSLFLCGTCILLRFWPSDLWDWMAPFVYVPGGLLLFWMLLQLLIVRVYRRIYLAMMVSLLVFTAWREYKFECNPSQGPASFRLFHWNVWSVRTGLEKIVEKITVTRPDVILLNEPKKSRNFPPYINVLKRRTASEWHLARGRNLVILSKYPLAEIAETSDREFQSLFAVVSTPKPVRVLLLDVSPALRNSRKQTFARVAAMTTVLRPDIIAGDFNTPAHARSLDPLLKFFHSRHCGLGYTWPTLAPLMKIDYILVRTGLKTANHQRGLTLLSDHAWQSLDVL